MVWVVLTFVVLVAVSVVIIAAVALPHLREESQMRVPRGEPIARDGRSRPTDTPADQGR